MNAKFGVLLKIMSALCATLMLACVKGLQGNIPTGEVIFFRSFVALFPLLVWLKSRAACGKVLKPKILPVTGARVFRYRWDVF